VLRRVLVCCLSGLTLAGHAQLELPGSLSLVGTAPEDKQVSGLMAPLTRDAAVSAEAARNQAVSFSTVSGPVWNVSLTPAPSSYTAGMLITVLPDLPNEAGIQVDVNGLGPRAVVKPGGLPLDTAELRGGAPARLLYDGDRFVVLGSIYRPCKPGYSPASRSLCVQDSTNESLTFFDAVNYCAQRDARLCSYAEWVASCQRVPGFLGSLTAIEWVDNAANNMSDAKTVGYGGDGQTGTPLDFGCDRGSTTASTNSRRFRCCTLR
jgi:hypothetical protein